MARRLGAHIHPILPLAVLEAVRSVDLPPADGLGEFDPELASKRLGLSRTVAAQITRYSGLARKGRNVEVEEVVGLLRLVGRRGDAEEVFAAAGRRVAVHATLRLPLALRLMHRALPRPVRRRLGLVLARRVVTRALGAAAARDGSNLLVVIDDSPSARATPGGTACELYGSAVATILQSLTGMGWTVSHQTCRARGDGGCRWRSTPGGAA